MHECKQYFADLNLKKNLIFDSILVNGIHATVFSHPSKKYCFWRYRANARE
jgi:hypothetical protein